MGPDLWSGRRRLALAVLTAVVVAPFSACSKANYDRPTNASAVGQPQANAADVHVRAEGEQPPHQTAREAHAGSHSRTTDRKAASPAAESEELALLATAKTTAELDALERDDDPLEDGWESEAIAEQANEQLTKLAKLLAHPDEVDADHLAEITAAEFSCGRLRPVELREVFRERSIAVFRAGNPQPSESDESHRGPAGFAAALRDLLSGLDAAPSVRAKFKLFRITPGKGQSGEGSFTTTAYYEASGRRSDGAVQQNATWTCGWSAGSPGAAPKLRSIEVTDYERVVVQSPSGTLFAECTEAALGDEPAYREQFAHGTDYWRERLEKSLNLFYKGHHGIAVGDVNGDSLEDVYVCQPGGMPNRLFFQQADGTLKDVSAWSQTDFHDVTRSALLLDFDNDGDQDLVVAASSVLLALANDGRGRFSLAAELPFGRAATSLAAADYDQDGKLDIYVCEYFAGAEEAGQLPVPFPYHDANNGGRNVLLRNEGNWKFRDVTAEVGLEENNQRFSFAAAWEDYDNDGDADLYVANDYGRNNLYRNDGGRFREVALESGAVDQNFGMSVAWGDYDHDGWMDLYVSNMFSAAGNRITFQPQFKQDLNTETRSVFQQFARGNTLLANAGDGTFRDVSGEAGVTMGRWSWGSLFADINNDGWQDLVVANGYITGKDPHDL